MSWVRSWRLVFSKTCLPPEMSGLILQCKVASTLNIVLGDLILYPALGLSLNLMIFKTTDHEGLRNCLDMLEKKKKKKTVLLVWNCKISREPSKWLGGSFPQEKDKKKTVLFFWQRELALNMIIATLGTWLFPLGRSNVIKAELLFQS